MHIGDSEKKQTIFLRSSEEFALLCDFYGDGAAFGVMGKKSGCSIWIFRKSTPFTVRSPASGGWIETFF